MKALKYSEILALNRELGTTLTGRDYRVALLSNIVMAQLGDILECQLRRRGIKAKVSVGDYDNIVQDSHQFRDFDAVVVFWELANLVEGLNANADVWGSEQLSALAERVEAEISLVLKNIQHVPLTLFNSFSSLIFSANDLRAGALTGLSSRLNQALGKAVSASQIIVDLDKVLAIVGLDQATDSRQYLSSKALYSVSFLKAYADHVEPAFCAATGRGRKILVLDCDNTLWGGILGEDGESGLQMSDLTSQGRVFREAQYLLKGLKEKGVLLALCSKNNPEDVDRVLALHPEMVLRDVDLVAKKVNWSDKASNILQLAEELNLGIDSFVFLDDSEFEVGLVEQELPQVRCFKVPSVLSDYPQLIRKIGREFFALLATKEDASKTEMYRQEQERKQVTAEFGTIEEYLKSLGLKLRVDWGRGISISRAAQLSQKTNQFNLTTRRYTESDIRRMLGDRRYLVATFAVADRFGDYGVVGLLILQHEQDVSVAGIDTLLMSCRVLGRNIDRAFFDYLFSKLTDFGIGRVESEYIRTGKNQQVADLYDTLGFRRLSHDEYSIRYEMLVADYRPTCIGYVEVSDGTE